MFGAFGMINDLQSLKTSFKSYFWLVFLYNITFLLLKQQQSKLRSDTQELDGEATEAKKKRTTVITFRSEY